MTSRREGRSISLGRHRDRQSRDQSRGGGGGGGGGGEEDGSTRQNVSNFMLTLQRVQTAEDENRQLRRENQILRQRSRSSRLSSASFSSGGGGGGALNRSASPSAARSPDRGAPAASEAEVKELEASVKRNSLIFVGDTPFLSQSPEHAALESQYKTLQTDFNTLKDFLKHLFHHALTMSPSPSPSSSSSSTIQDGRGNGHTASLYKDSNSYPKDTDVNTYNPIFSKQLEHSLEDIHGEISQLRSCQDQQKLRMEQVQLALDNVLNQSSVRNDVTMRIVRQQDKVKDMQRHVTYLECQLMEVNKSLRQAEERLNRMDKIQHNMEYFISANGKSLKGTAKSDLTRYLDQMSQIHQRSPHRSKMAVPNKMVAHIRSASSQGQGLMDSKPPVDVIDTMSKLERLIGSDWHRFGRMLGLSVDCLDDIGKFTNFDLTTRVEKVMAAWSRSQKGANGDLLRQALAKMDRDILLLAESPVSREMCPVTPDVLAFFVAHVVDVSSMCHTLAWQGVLSQDSIAFILGVSEEYRRASRLIHTIVYMGLSALQSLCHVLDTSNQTHVSFKLKGCLPGNGEDNTWEVLQSSSFTLPHTSPTSPTHHHHNNNNNNNNNNVYNNQGTMKTDTSVLENTTTSPSSSSSTSTSHHRPKTRDKQRQQKRSRSLFTRKHKHREQDDPHPEDLEPVAPEPTNPRDSYYPVTVV